MNPFTGAPRPHRPTVELSQNLVNLYRQVNEEYFLRKRKEGPGPFYNDGFDDHEGHYIVIPGEEIVGRYAVHEVLGKGSFGTVVKCLDNRRQEAVALKISRSGRTFRNQAKMEIDILMKLNDTPALTDFVARLRKVFEWKGHLVLAFELLGHNLYQLIQLTHFNGVSLDLTRKFAWQILTVLNCLQNHDPPIIHCDLKPENVLLKYNNRSGIRVIDFGSACYANRMMFRYIQSRFYRSPEVILGMEYTTAIDRWSLGCMLVELHCGMPIFDGRSEPQQLQRFIGLLGPIPYRMLEAGDKTANFYMPPGQPYQPGPDDQQINTIGPNGEVWRLKSPPQSRHVRSLRQILGVDSGGPGGRRQNQAGHDQATYESFCDLILRLLAFDPAERISVQGALNHPFVMAVQPRPVMPAGGGGGGGGSLLPQGQQQQQQHSSQQGSGGGGGGGTGGVVNSSSSSSSHPQQQQQQQSLSSSSIAQQQSSASTGNNTNTNTNTTNMLVPGVLPPQVGSINVVGVPSASSSSSSTVPPPPPPPPPSAGLGGIAADPMQQQQQQQLVDMLHLKGQSPSSSASAAQQQPISSTHHSSTSIHLHGAMW